MTLRSGPVVVITGRPSVALETVPGALEQSLDDVGGPACPRCAASLPAAPKPSLVTCSCGTAVCVRGLE